MLFEQQMNPLSWVIHKLHTSMHYGQQCWTEARSSTAVAKDLRPTATVAEVEAIPTAEGLIGSFHSFFSKMEAEMCFSLHRCHLRLN